MNGQLISTPLSAREFLFGVDDVAGLDGQLTAAGALRDARARLGGLGEDVWAGTHKELAAAASRFLDLDLSSVALAGWRKHRELLRAADQTRGTRASAVVPLGSRDITLTQHPHIDVITGKVTVSVVRFELKVEIKATGVVGVVRDGALVALQGGRCHVTVSFSAAGALLCRKAADVDLQRAVRLGNGIPLKPHAHAVGRG